MHICMHMGRTWTCTWGHVPFQAWMGCLHITRLSCWSRDPRRDQHTSWRVPQGAERLLRLAFPVSSYFDDELYALAGGYGDTAQEVSLERAGVESPRELRAIHTSVSLFAQRSKQPGLNVSSLIH